MRKIFPVCCASRWHSAERKTTMQKASPVIFLISCGIDPSIGFIYSPIRSTVACCTHASRLLNH